MLAIASGCGSVPSTVSAADADNDSSTLPFSAEKKGMFSTAGLVPDSVTVPAGTPISVRLQNAVSSASARPGDEFAAESPEGEEALLRVLEVRPDGVLVDANHPLAGLTLRYDVKIREVRVATDEEIAEAAAGFEASGYDEPAPHGEGEAALVQLRPKKSQEK